MTGLIVDLFAGGGGVSLGMKWALGRDPDIAINHDPFAIAMHRANHPGTTHYTQDVWRIPPLFATKGRPVDVLWASPACNHFSRARGGKPRKNNIRDLAHVLVEWAKWVKPILIILENVAEFLDWGPLDKNGNPIKARKREIFDRWVRQLRGHGYRVEWRLLGACDYGAPTFRKRLFLIARRDDQPIVWPEPTHGPEGSGLLPYRTAAECIDWSLPCPSIFMSADEARALRKQTGIICKRPLADNTMKRIARGLQKYVLDAAEPFIVSYYGPKKEGVEFRGQGLDDPLATQTTENRFGLVTPFVQHIQHSNKAGSMPADEPLRTITAYPMGGGMALVNAFLVRHFGRSVGQSPAQPALTCTAGGGGHTGLALGHLIKMKGENTGQDAREPLQTITAGGNHFGAVRAFLTKYHGQGVGVDLSGPASTVTSKHRLGLVTVNIQGEAYAIADIGLRMLQPRELFRAQGFPESYIIDQGPGGKELTKEKQVKFCGNSVCPQMANALVRANYEGAAQRIAA